MHTEAFELSNSHNQVGIAFKRNNGNNKIGVWDTCETPLSTSEGSEYAFGSTLQLKFQHLNHAGCGLNDCNVTIY